MSNIFKLCPARLFKSFSFFLLTFGSLTAQSVDSIKIWQSNDGRQIEARILQIDATNQIVQMERSDGLRFSAKWSQFSPQEYARFEQAASHRYTASIPKDNTSITKDLLPDKHKLKGVPMVKQKQNFCVPASATMIAGFHGIETNQDEVAELSSKMSAGNNGTYPSDMLHAMQKLGFDGRQKQWSKEKDFHNSILPAIRHALYHTGPIYISFNAGVFGDMGHGCVIVGYNDRRQKLHFYNPWGNEFEKEYKTVAFEARGIALINPPAPAPVASDDLIDEVQSIVPQFGGNFLKLASILNRASQPHEFVWCSRRDSRDDQRFARNTARDDGRKILELSFERNPAVIIPHSINGNTEKYYFVTRPSEGGARFLVRTIDDRGWSEPELLTLGTLTRNWVTAFNIPGNTQKFWDLPMIELHSTRDK